MPGLVAIEDPILNYDPELPQERFRSAGVAAVDNSAGRLPRPSNSSRQLTGTL
jgi:hypothetical protein